MDASTIRWLLLVLPNQATEAEFAACVDRLFTNEFQDRRACDCRYGRTIIGAGHVIRFLITFLGLYRDYGFAAFIRSTLVCGTTRSAQLKNGTGRVLSR